MWDDEKLCRWVNHNCAILVQYNHLKCDHDRGEKRSSCAVIDTVLISLRIWHGWVRRVDDDTSRLQPSSDHYVPRFAYHCTVENVASLNRNIAIATQLAYHLIACEYSRRYGSCSASDEWWWHQMSDAGTSGRLEALPRRAQIVLVVGLMIRHGCLRMF